SLPSWPPATAACGLASSGADPVAPPAAFALAFNLGKGGDRIALAHGAGRFAWRRIGGRLSSPAIRAPGRPRPGRQNRRPAARRRLRRRRRATLCRTVSALGAGGPASGEHVHQPAGGDGKPGRGAGRAFGPRAAAHRHRRDLRPCRRQRLAHRICKRALARSTRVDPGDLCLRGRRSAASLRCFIGARVECDSLCVLGERESGLPARACASCRARISSRRGRAAASCLHLRPPEIRRTRAGRRRLAAVVFFRRRRGLERRGNGCGSAQGCSRNAGRRGAPGFRLGVPLRASDAAVRRRPSRPGRADPSRGGAPLRIGARRQRLRRRGRAGLHRQRPCRGPHRARGGGFAMSARVLVAADVADAGYFADLALDLGAPALSLARFTNPRAAWLRALEETRPQVVLAEHWRTAAPDLLLALRECSTPYAVFLLEPPASHFLLRPRSRAWRTALAGAEALVAPTAFVREAWIARGAPPERFALIPALPLSAPSPLGLRRQPRTLLLDASHGCASGLELIGEPLTLHVIG